MLFSAIDKACAAFAQLGWKEKLKESVLYGAYKWVRSIPMHFDNRIVNLYSRETFRKILNDKDCTNWVSLWLQSYQQNPKDTHWALRLADPVPWINFKAICFMEFFLMCRQNAIVFEYGSGTSTVWFSKRAHKVFSVEDNQQWFNEVGSALKARGVVNAECFCAPPEALRKEDAHHYSSMGRDNVSFEKYVKTVLRYPGTFDIIYIDGRSRPACMELAPAKLKDGGIIVLDNADRDRYSGAIESVKNQGFSMLETRGPTSYGEQVGETYFFHKGHWSL